MAPLPFKQSPGWGWGGGQGRVKFLSCSHRLKVLSSGGFGQEMPAVCSRNAKPLRPPGGINGSRAVCETRPALGRTGQA